MRRIATRELSALGAVALAGQLGLVARIAALGAAEAVALAALAILLVAPLVHRLRPAGARRLAMLGLGGLGMTLGWWADLGFRSASDAALRAGAGFDTLWCGFAVPARPGAPAVGHLWSWMSAGMLAFGIPIAALRPRPPSQLACGIGMLLGMSAGSWLAASLAAGLGPSHAVPADYALMSLGMLVGMLAQERLSRAWRGSPLSRGPHSPARRARRSGTLDLRGSSDGIPGRSGEGTRSVRDGASGAAATAAG